jgi:hypothetical protein
MDAILSLVPIVLQQSFGAANALARQSDLVNLHLHGDPGEGTGQLVRPRPGRTPATPRPRDNYSRVFLCVRRADGIESTGVLAALVYLG